MKALFLAVVMTILMIGSVPALAGTVELNCEHDAISVTEFRFYRSDTQGGPYSLIGSSSTCSFTDSTAPPQNIYYVATAMYDWGAESLYSNECTPGPSIGTPPTGLSCVRK